MSSWRRSVSVLVVVVAFLASVSTAAAQQSTGTFEPRVGQAGKDVVWVPTPQALVDKMLELAQVTPSDFLMDLGSGDGITVISAAKRGVRAVGIEYNADMVELSRRNAAAAGITRLASFQKADLFETDLSKATVITMFLLPSINMKLRPTLLDLAPGTRIVSNTFHMEDWEPDVRETIPNCDRWCTALLWIVPAKVQGTWRVGSDTLSLTQTFQKVSGTLGSTPVSDGQLRGDAIAFTVGGAKYTGRVAGNRMSGTYAANGRTQQWSATRN
jgi:hypothetical protein